MAALGLEELERYLVDQIQEVSRSQSASMNDRHIKVIRGQMLLSVRVTLAGDSDFHVINSINSSSWKMRA